MAKLPNVVGFVDARLGLETSDIIWTDSRDYTGHLAPYLILGLLLPIEAVSSIAVRDFVIEAPGLRRVALVYRMPALIRDLAGTRCRSIWLSSSCGPCKGDS
jgi:hypothetical protein